MSSKWSLILKTFTAYAVVSEVYRSSKGRPERTLRERAVNATKVWRSIWFNATCPSLTTHSACDQPHPSPIRPLSRNNNMHALHEGAELRGESGKTYLAVSALGQENVWTAVDKDDVSTIVVLKGPASTDIGTSWPRFQHEMIMHELFKECKHVRKQVDRIPPVQGSTSPPILVLEMMETTLWDARKMRSFTTEEVKLVATYILLGLAEIHQRGLVFADLKMQNVMINGFSASESNSGKLLAKLGDLGIVMSPSRGKVQPVTYRAPEVYFKGEITQAADIWAFGLVYCHLLEAQKRFTRPGLYDDLYTGTGTMPEREQAMRYALSDDYDVGHVDYFKGCPLPYRDERKEIGHQWEELRKRGLEEDDISFLKKVLVPDPRERPTAQAILMSRWFGGDGDLEPTKSSSHVDDPPDSSEVGVTNGSAPPARHRRDASSSGPAGPGSIAMPTPRPEALLRGQSQALYTPSVTTPAAVQAGPWIPPGTAGGTQVFNTLAQKHSESTNPLRSHPLMASVLSPPAEEPAAEDKAMMASDDAMDGVEKEHAGANGQTNPVSPPTSPPPMYRGTTQPNVLSPDRRPQPYSRSSTSGGTWLNYR
ncbi:hypothetical protein BAUCODRAFT_37076 [Baudoinia panamericana UAMH 10762]|uniref:cyclin-dependent kinase n=1 Tax=Baudoinia panamericana (strain UAMH 10762) TaxID=717646 RepID=M2MPK1_BAUPA|nr:uncharacterized protein BAUCODRAFT_37076 [Baudoinia panamericana UAMH 10762]EMC93388.1 hypothetical protein BAUCODRAFT_37076 [Baudoinia panamericana UAMH 10762]